MISPREFCREPGFGSALLLTYTFDPLHFERVVFSDLSYGGAEKIIVIADAGEVEKAMERSAGQLRQLGRRYLLVPAKIDYAFHPKLIARFGRQDGKIWIGSGNLTAGGWGGNWELAAFWKVGPQEDDHGIWLHDLLTQSQDWAEEDFQKRELRGLLDHAWLGKGPYENRAGEAPVLLGSSGQSLADDLATRWSGRRFKEMRLMTGSTDEDGAFLRWAHETFGVDDVTIYMTPANASYEPSALDRLPMKISFLPAPSDAMLHAKFYWFSGDGGSAAVVGSANASRSAWQLIEGARGNVELVVPYDNPSPDDFETLLADLNGEDLSSPAEVLGLNKAEKEPDQEPPKFRLAALDVSYGASGISARIDPVPEMGADVSIMFRPGSVSTGLERDGNLWLGQLPEDAPGIGGAMFASAIIETDEGEFTTPLRWADCIEEIRQTGRARSAGSAINDLIDRRSSNNEQAQVLRAIQAAADFILEIKEDEFDDTGGGRRGDPVERNEGGENVGAVDPDALLRSIADSAQRGTLRGNLSPGQIGQLSFGGVMRSLFAVEAQDISNDESQVKAEPEIIDEASEQESENSRAGQFGESNPNISERSRVRLGEQLDEFVERLSSVEFAENCSPRQLLEAAAFPVAVSINAVQGGWFGSAHVGQIAMRVCSILFEQRYGRGLPVGLLNFVRARLEAEGCIERFDEVLGDGRLWCVLIASVCAAKSTKLSTVIHKAEILRQVYGSDVLLSTAREEDVRLFLNHLRQPGAALVVAEIAPDVIELVDRIKHYLTENWDSLYAEQGNGRQLHRPGDVLWSQDWGWEQIGGGTTYAQYYLNIGWTKRDHPEFGELVDQLIDILKSDSDAVGDQPS